MPKNATRIEVDVRQARRALVSYAVATGKTLADSADRQAKNLAIKTYMAMPHARAAAIRAVGQQSWWPALIAKIMASAGPYDVDEARAVSKRLLNRRARSAGYMRTGVARAAHIFGDTKSRATSRHTMARARGRHATKRTKQAEWTVDYLTARGAKDKANKERLAGRALRAAVPAMVQDMETYTARKLREQARRHSAR